PGNIVRVESASFVLDLVAADRGVTIQPSLTVRPRDDVAVLELARTIPVTWWAHLGTGADEAAESLVDRLATDVTSALAQPTVSVRG
ncbi:MAG: hypothetical protein AAGE98_22360, partial [Actinomycetota bacterium]